MREYGKLGTSIWSSRKFRKLPNNDARLFYIYLLACPHGNSIGCFRLPKGYVMADLNLSNTAIDTAIHTCIDTGLIGWNEEEEVVRIVDFLAHSPINNGKHGAGAAKAALLLPDCDQKLHIINELSQIKTVKNTGILPLPDTPIDTGIHTLPPTETETETQTQTETETETETKNSVSIETAKNASFVKEVIWKNGLFFLKAKNVSEDRARKVIGRWLKDYGDTALIAALEQARKADTGDPVPYILEVLKGESGGLSDDEIDRIAEQRRVAS